MRVGPLPKVWVPWRRPPDNKGDAQDQQAVTQDRADQRRLHHSHQPGAQGKDGDKQFGEVAER